MKDRGELGSDLVALKGEDLGPNFWANAHVVEPKEPKSVHLKLDPEVFDYFKGQGKGHLTRMQEVLKAYVRAHRDGR
jgi:BrnA antitoxin of type II toxin-antitoxin system